MSSFFLKGKPKPATKRKFNNHQKPTRSKAASDDEVDSDDEALNSNNVPDADTDEDVETPQDKRLRLAKKYLEEIEKQEKLRAEDVDETPRGDVIGTRLKEEYLDSVGKLRRNVAELYTGYNQKTIKILKHKTQKQPITCVILSTDDKFMFTGSKTASVVKWDLKTLQHVGKFDCAAIPEAGKNGIQSKGANRRRNIVTMCLSTDMKYLVVADGGNDINIWCPKELKHLKTFKGHRDLVTGLVFRRDTHQLYSASKDRSIKIWSLDEMAYVESLFGHQAGITSIDALYRERAVTSGGTDCTLRIWKITEESQLIFNGHRGTIEIVKLINDENFLSCGDDGSLCVWSTLKKKALCTQPLIHGTAENGEANWITSIATLVNTDLLASGSCDGFVRLWQMTDSGRKLKQIFEIPLKGFVNSLAFTSDGSRLIAGVGQEHRLGRWWRCKDAKNGVVVIELNKKSSS